MKRTVAPMAAALLVLGVALTGLVAPTAARAATHSFGKAKVWTPDSWRVKSGRVLRATPPNKRGLVAFETTGQRSLGEASKRLRGLVRKYVGSAKHGAPVRKRVGKHDALSVSGVGNMDGMAIRYTAYLYRVGGEVILGIAFAPKPAYAKHSTVMNKILGSLR